MGLRAKFNLAMLVSFVFGLTLAAGFAYTIVRDSARREVLQDARIMLEQAAAIRGYTDKEIAPLLAAQSRVKFLPHTVPSWAAQTNFAHLQHDFPDYSYKEAALNPTNPADRASDWQADIIGTFRQNAAMNELISERETPNGPVIELSHPLRVSDAACLACHSVPAAAPASMIEQYGSANGFGWKLDEVVGAQVITVPLRVALDTGFRSFLLFMGALAAVFALMMLVLNLLLGRIIIAPIRAISRMADEVSLGNLEMAEYERRGSDEIASLANSFNRMRRSVVNAMKLLDAE
jgi:protein-histidine pros-kinase